MSITKELIKLGYSQTHLDSLRRSRIDTKKIIIFIQSHHDKMFSLFTLDQIVRLLAYFYTLDKNCKFNELLAFMSHLKNKKASASDMENFVIVIAQKSEMLGYLLTEANFILLYLSLENLLRIIEGNIAFMKLRYFVNNVFNITANGHSFWKTLEEIISAENLSELNDLTPKYNTRASSLYKRERQNALIFSQRIHEAYIKSDAPRAKAPSTWRNKS